MGERAEYDAPGFVPGARPPEVARVLETEFSERFAEGMRSRMVVSFHKYGPAAGGFPERVDALASLERRLALYRATGNAEWLVDVANFAMIEFMHPRHPGAHFRPTDSDESPGRERFDGQDGAAGNAQRDLALERLRAKYGPPMEA